MTNQELVKQLRNESSFDSVSHSVKNKTITTKREFFYRNGENEGVLVNKLITLYPNLLWILDSGEEYLPWPKDSFWWVKFRVREEGARV